MKALITSPARVAGDFKATLESGKPVIYVGDAAVHAAPGETIDVMFADDGLRKVKPIPADAIIRVVGETQLRRNDITTGRTTEGEKVVVPGRLAGAFISYNYRAEARYFSCACVLVPGRIPGTFLAVGLAETPAKPMKPIAPFNPLVPVDFKLTE
jgi:hypothetical protein